ncbi:MAG TPA: flagellar export protein FliJ [Spirochaetota bacterium]|jgi:flagellar FliJ protein|nr:flagellar export protein FliJ [Spirochaetota bacterium]OQA96708.1 MAG: Flagellar FliJ protein [Spirochaetes bacterium ADurb.Bin218]HON17029.1 flagellar export protein FliJ [Spirochaetota bacterium]HOV09108.1 flagellar export protein FliJ [Spirochaetota bacterium]HPX91606.1 flagellar export protein FliJ [Spirochaetota bacterium]
MKRFQFKLQKLLDLREAKEKEIKNELMKVLSEQNRERNFQHELNEKIAEYEGKLSEMQKKGVFNPAEAMAILRFADVSRNAIVASEKRVQALEPEVQRIRERLVVASREKKVVEKLKERKLDEYNYELNREISKENDDMNQKIYHKKIM